MLKTIKIVIDKSEPELCVTNFTPRLNKEIADSGLKEGAITVYIPGSTAGVTTMEYEPNLIRDLSHMLERVTPSDIEYEHHKTWGEGNGKSHIRSSLFGTSLTIPFMDGKLPGDEWQQVVILDFDIRIRKREVIIQITDFGGGQSSTELINPPK